MSVGTLDRDLRQPIVSAGPWRVLSVFPGPATVVVVALTALGAALRFIALGHQGFWFDEANTALLVHFSPGKMIGLIPQTESTPPLYYCVAWVWARIFGYGEAGLRSLSALAGVLSVPVAYGAGAKLISRRAGVIAAALTACNPFLIWYSQEARSYSLLVLLSGATLLTFAYALERPTPRLVAAWVIASALALATHYYALLAVVPEAIWLLAARRRERSVQVGLGLVALCGAALVPLAISQNGTGHASWIAPIPLAPRLGQIVPQFLIGFQTPAQRALERISEVVAVIAILMAVLSGDRITRRGALGAGALAVGGLILNLLLIAGGVDDLITRNVIALWLPAALLIAGGLASRPDLGRMLGRFRSRRVFARAHTRRPVAAMPRMYASRASRPAALIGVAGTLALCAIGIVATLAVASDRNFQRPDWRGVARLLGPRPAAGSPGRAILVQHYRDLLPLSLYLHGLKPIKGSGATVSELDVVSFTAPRVMLCWWGAACNLSSSRMQSSYPVAGFRVLWRRHIYQFTVLHMVASSPLRVTPQDISRVLRTTHLPADELLLQR